MNILNILKASLLSVFLFLILICSNDRCAAAPVSDDEADGREREESPDQQGMEDPGMKPYGWKRLGDDLGYYFKTPARFDKKNARNICIFAGMTAFLYAERKDIRETVLESKTDPRMDIYETARISSRGAFDPALALLFLASGKLRHRDYDIETAQIIMESYALSSIMTGVGSFILTAERPEDGDDIRFFHTQGHGVSLDVALSSSFVFPVIDRYLKVKSDDTTGRKVIKRTSQVLLFSLPALTAMQRMSADKHWAPDVFLGGLVGLSTGKILANVHEKERPSKIDVSFSAGMVQFRF